MHKEYTYTSCFGELIYAYIESRRAAGFMYDNPAYWLYRFDQFCVERNTTVPTLTKELFDSWSIMTVNESKTTQNNRLTALRCFSRHLTSLGLESYVPHTLPRPEKKVPYLMEDADIHAFFDQVDAYHTVSNCKAFIRMESEYKLLYRLLFCCGLRNSEACSLKSSDVDLINGRLTIVHSKGDKNRIVYLSGDLHQLCKEYKCWLDLTLPQKPEWFFPSRLPEKHIPKTSVDRKFNEFWNKTEISKHCDKKPTVHSLRHAFVIKRINLWMDSEIELQAMMPYLSNYLGHTGPVETYYYYHQVEEAFNIIRQKDNFAYSVIPEVTSYE
jgi:integrase